VLAGVKRVLVGRLDRGADLLRGIREAVERSGIRSGIVMLLGALGTVRVGYYDPSTKEYSIVEASGNFEVTSGVGNVSVREDGDLVVHLHITAQDRSGRVVAGHVMEGCIVSVTVEYAVLELDAQLTRRYDEETGLYLLT